MQPNIPRRASPARLLTRRQSGAVFAAGMAASGLMSAASHAFAGGDVSGGAPRVGGTNVATFERRPWRLVRYAGAGGQLLPGLPGTEVTATFAAGQVTGSAGCNRYTGGYTLMGSTIRVTGVASTQAFCASPPGLMQQETAYLADLRRATRVDASGDTLRLGSVTGATLLEYVPQVQTPLEGTTWSAESYNNGRGGVVSLIAGTRITAWFDGGNVSGSAGCNNYNAGYSLGGAGGSLGGTITIGPAASTRMFCGDPPGVMDQETAYLAALSTANRYRIEGDRLTLETNSGARVASYRVAASDVRSSASDTEPDAESAPAETSAVTGTLMYRERIALPPDATATVLLVDASRADAPAITVAEQTIDPAGQVPIEFRLVYDPSTIDPRNRYLVRGTIGVGDQLLFTTTQAYPVLTQGAVADVELVLQRA